MKKPMIIMLICMGILFAAIFGYKAFMGFMIGKYLRANSSPPITVSTIKAVKDFWQPEIQTPTTFRAIAGVDVTTELAGIVRIIYFAPGAEVKKGDLLVQLNIDADLAHLQSLEAEALLAKSNFSRDQAQFAIKAVSKAVVEADEAQLKNKNAQVAEQKAIIEKKMIRAPFAGRLGISAINPGQYINPGDKVVTLQALDPIYADFFIPQQFLHRIALGQTVTVTSDAFMQEKFSGKIKTIDPKVDPQTRNIMVEAVIANPNKTLLPGMFGTIVIKTEQPVEYLTLPQTAVSYNPYGDIVYIVKEQGKDKDGKPILIAHESFVSVGASHGDQITILKGIKENDVVVTAGQLKLKNGSRVLINNDVQPSNEKLPQLMDE